MCGHAVRHNRGRPGTQLDIKTATNHTPSGSNILSTHSSLHEASPFHHSLPRPRPFLLQEVCYQYWPDEMGKVEQFGEFDVSLLEIMEHDGFIERICNISDSKVHSSIILHYCTLTYCTFDLSSLAKHTKSPSIVWEAGNLTGPSSTSRYF